MNNVFEVVTKEKVVNYENGVRMWQEKSLGLFHFEQHAIKCAKDRNDSITRRLVKEATRMTGTVRGSNADKYEEIVQKILNPPYIVKPRRLNRR